MKLKLSENPKEWRKAGVFSALGFAVLSSLLRWRHHLRQPVWLVILAVLALVMVTAILRPRWFRPWYRLTGWIAFQIGQAIGRVAFALAFFLVITPAGLILRLFRYDPLHLKHDPAESTYWNKAKDTTPLDRMF